MRFLLVGLVGLGLNEVLIWLLVEGASMFYLAAAVLSSELTILTNFWMNEHWTFRDRATDRSLRALFGRVLHYNWTRAVGLALGLTILFMLTGLLGVHYLVSNVIAIGLGILWGYGTSLTIVWKSPAANVVGTRDPEVVGLQRAVDRLFSLSHKVAGPVLSTDRRLWIATIIFIATWTSVQVHFYENFRIYTWDMGIWNQSFWTTVHGQNMYYTSELFINRDGFFLATHFAPAIYLLVPLYALAPRIETLFLIHTALVALSAHPIYRITLRATGEKRNALAVACFFLILPGTLGMMIVGLHLEDLFLLFTLCAIASWRHGSFSHFVAYTGLALASIEWAAVPISLMCFGLAIAGGGLHSRRSRIALGVLVASVLWLLLAMQARYSLGLLITQSPWAEWEILGASSLSEVPFQVFLAPNRIVPALMFDLPWKAQYLLAMLLPLAFLPLSRPLLVLPTIPLVGMALLSNYRLYYSVWNQYPAFVLPFLAVAFSDAITEVRLQRWRIAWVGTRDRAYLAFRRILFGKQDTPPRIRKIRGRTLSDSTVRAVSIMVVLWLIGIGSSLGQSLEPFVQQYDSDHNAIVHRALSMIPTNTSVLTQSNLFPHVSNRASAYTIPSPGWGAAFDDAARGMLDKLDCRGIEYVVVDFDSPPLETAGGRLIDQYWVTQKCNRSSQVFRPLLSEDGVILYRNTAYTGVPP